MTVQMCLLTDTRSAADNPKFLYVWPVNDFTDSDGKGWSGRSKFDYTANSLGSDAEVPRKDSNGNVVLWRLRRIMGSGTRSWPEDLSDLTAGVALDAATAALDDIVPIPGSPIQSVPMVTRALLNGVEVDPDAEGVLNLGNLSTSAALTAETNRATTAETANASAISAEATARASGDTANAAAIATETTRATTAEGLKGPILPTVGSFTYNTDGTVATDADGNSYTYNADGTVHTQTRGGVTRTYTYNTDGSLSGVA